MSQLGMGVMINMLSDDGHSTAVFAAAVGKTIRAVALGGDDALHFVFTDDSKIVIADEGQSCCESRYMRTDDDLSTFAGAKLLGALVKEAPDVETEYDTHEVQFLEVQTDRGVFTMASHNEHNGYYGGFSVRVREEA